MSLLPTMNAFHVDGKGHYDYFFALAGEAASQWSKYPAISTINVANNNIVSTNSINLSSQVVTATPEDILLNGVPITTSTVRNWSRYTAQSDVNIFDYKLLSTSALQLNDQYITATNNSILLNGIPFVTDTFSSLSSITEWAYYAALSTVDMNLNLIEGCTGIQLNGNQVTTGTSNTIRVNGQNPVAVWNTYTATGNVNMGNNNIVAIDTLSAVTGSITSNVSQNVITNKARVNWDLIGLSTSYLSIVNSSTISASTITAATVYANSSITTNTTASNVILSNATNTNILTTTGATLLYNGVTVNTGAAGNVALWSQFPGVSAINNNRGYGNTALSMLGTSFFNGDVQFRQNAGSLIPTMEFDRTSGGGPYFNINNAKFYAQGLYNQIGQSNAGPYLSDNYILGRTFLDGGTFRPISIGCLPPPVGPPINTQRIDVTPAGILLTTPTFVTVNGLGAMNIAMGGAVAIGAGSYVTLEHGFGLGSNGVYVQVPARNDTARLLLEFGGSVGPSIDNPATPAKVDFHGQNLFIQNITNTFDGNRWPRTKDLFIDSISTLEFVNGSGITVLPLSTLSLSGSLNLSSASQYVNAYNVSSVNLYVESIFTSPGVGQINVYDPLALSQWLTVQQFITAPKVSASTIYGTSGATINGNLWLETPLVTATNNLRVTNTLYSEDARFQGQTTVSSIQSFVGTPVTFNNSQTNLPNNATISSLSVSTINGIQMPNMPIEFYELTVPANVWSVSGSLLAEQTITITSTSRIWAIAAVEYNNTGSGGSNNYFIDTYITLSLPLVTYSSTRASIPDRFTPTIPSSTNVTVQQVTAAQAPGTYTLRVYAAASATNTTMTCTHCDFTVSAGYF